MTDTETKDSPGGAARPCELCAPSAPPGVTPDEAYTNYFAIGYAAGLNGLTPVLCAKHALTVAEWVAKVTRAVDRAVDPTADISARVMVQLARATGLSPAEVLVIGRQHKADGLSAAESFKYFQKVAAARGVTLVAADALEGTGSPS